MEEKTDSQPSDKRSKIGYWHKWIKSAKKAMKDHWRDTQSAYDVVEYRSTNDGTTENVSQIPYPIYKFSCDQLEPAYFAKTPKIVSKRRFGVDDDVALTMSLIQKRLGQVVVDESNFQDGMAHARADFIHSAKATTQVIYTSVDDTFRKPLTIDPTTGEVKFQDELYEGEYEEDDDGPFVMETRVNEDSQRLYLAPAPFDEILHTPTARCWAEITELAYYFCLDKDEAEEMFNADRAKTLPYKPRADSKRKDSEDEYSETKSTSTDLVLTGWEIYCKHSNKKYWVSEDFKDDFLLVTDNNEEFADTFPSPPFAIYNKHRNSLATTPNWVFLEPTANQLNTLYTRIFGLISSIRRRAIVHGASPELLLALNSLGDQQFLTAGDMSKLLQEGGVDKMIEWIPVQELVQALSEAMNIEEHFKNLFYEWFGLPDIIRGVSDPNEGVGSQKIKAAASDDRFKMLKAKMVGLARDSAELLVDMALKVYSDDKIMRLVGYDYLEPEHQQRFPEALARLRNDKERMVRLDFETESTSFQDQERELQRQQMISTHVMQGLNAIAGLGNPEYIPIALKLLLSTLEQMGGSTQSEDMIKAAISDLTKMQEQQQGQPQQPDYEMMKIEVEKMKIESKNQIDQLDNMLKREIEAQKAMLKQRELEGKEFKIKSDSEIGQFTAQVNAAVEKALVALESQRLEIDSFKANILAQEALLEEVRLKQDSDTERLRMVVDTVKNQGVTSEQGQQAQSEPKIIQLPAPPAQDIKISLDTGKSKRKRIIRDQTTGEISEIIEDSSED